MDTNFFNCTSVLRLNQVADMQCLSSVCPAPALHLARNTYIVPLRAQFALLVKIAFRTKQRERLCWT